MIRATAASVALHDKKSAEAALEVVHNLTPNAAPLVVGMDDHIHYRGHVFPVIDSAAKADELVIIKCEALECALTKC